MKRKGLFDRFSEWVDRQISRSWWFVVCLAFVVGWFVQGVIGNLWTNDIWHLELNSPTTAATFLMVALGANSAWRAWKAVHEKLNANVRAQAQTMRFTARLASALAPDIDCTALMADAEELEASVGLEDRVGTKRNASKR